MRIKALLLTAILGVGGVATTIAQTNTNYTQNAVGYVNLNLPPGFAMIANPLLNTTNDLDTILTNVPQGTTLYFLSNSTSLYASTTFTNGAWTPLDGVLIPGNGALVFVPSQATATFVGNVPQGTFSLPIPAGLSILSAQVPVSVSLTNNTLNFPAVNGDTVYRFNSASGHFIISTYSQGLFQPADVIPAVGESFFVLKTAAAVWTTQFTVNDATPRRWTNSLPYSLLSNRAASAFAQGTVNFCNLAGTFNQPILDAQAKPLDTNGSGNFLAELMAGPDAAHLSLIPSSITKIANGQFFGGSVSVPNPPTNGVVALQVIAWDGTAAADFATATQKGAAIGQSTVFNASLSTALFPVPPVTMSNFTSFKVQPGGSVGTNSLTITLIGTNAVVGWPAATNVLLQSNFGLSVTNWKDITATLGLGRYTNAIAKTNTFYRTVTR